MSPPLKGLVLELELATTSEGESKHSLYLRVW